MTSLAQWRNYMVSPGMSAPARRRRLSTVYAPLAEWYSRVHPEEQHVVKIVLDAVTKSYDPRFSYAVWAAAARSRLQLEFVSDNLKVRAIKLERPVIECPVLEVRNK